VSSKLFILKWQSKVTIKKLLVYIFVLIPIVPLFLLQSSWSNKKKSFISTAFIPLLLDFLHIIFQVSIFTLYWQWSKWHHLCCSFPIFLPHFLSLVALLTSSTLLLLKYLIFSDEYTFLVTEKVNKWNVKIWEGRNVNMKQVSGFKKVFSTFISMKFMDHYCCRKHYHKTVH
jgi:hypothetical protein